MSTQIVTLSSDIVTVKRIGDTFRKVLSNPDRLYSRSQNNTTITLACPVRNIHDDDLGASRDYPMWTAEYIVRPRREPAFSMSTTGFHMKSGAEHERMQAERSRYLKGLAEEIMSALETSRFNKDVVSIRLQVRYGQLTVFIDLNEKN